MSIENDFNSSSTLSHQQISLLQGQIRLFKHLVKRYMNSKFEKQLPQLGLMENPNTTNTAQIPPPKIIGASNPGVIVPAPVIEEKEDTFEDADEEVVYSNYQPPKLGIGHEHPDRLVQSASLAAVLPPDITYELQLPSDLIESRGLSSAQLETVAYASQIHEKFLTTGSRCGFFLGDGAGVGKGRQLAALVLENWLQGRHKHIWLSAHADLSFDATRDLQDIGAGHIKAQPLKDLPYASIGKFEGVIFSTYTALTSKSRTGLSRLMQLVKWCGEDFDGCILFGKSFTMILTVYLKQ